MFIHHIVLSLKLLFLANRVPYPPYRGDKLKIYNLAKRLREKHELHLLTFAQTREDLTYVRELEKIFSSVRLVYLPKWKSALNCVAGLWSDKPFQVLYFRSRAMEQALHETLRQHQFDAVHVQHLRMAPYLAGVKYIPRILDLPDAFSLYWERRQQIPRGKLRRIFEQEEQKRVLRYEPVLSAYNMALTCSPEDLEYLRQKHHTDNLRLLPNGVDLDIFVPRSHDYSSADTLLFTGNMDYAPNVDAVIYFTEQVLPLVRKQNPGVRFVIAGQRPVKKVRDLAREGITVTGFVKDLAGLYREAGVVVAPLRFGAGTQNKVLEAMAMGVPVVCSHIGFQGLGIENGSGAFMETTPEGFAAQVNKLLSDEALRRVTGEKGRAVAVQKFNWDTISVQLEAYFREVSMNADR